VACVALLYLSFPPTLGNAWIAVVFDMRRIVHVASNRTLEVKRSEDMKTWRCKDMKLFGTSCGGGRIN
jgi:hypothetical protein